MVHLAYDFIMGDVGVIQQQRVAFRVKKGIRARVIVETRSDLVHHPYIQLIDNWELDISGNKKRKIRIINLYDNGIGEGYQWKGDKNEKRWAIDDIEWDEIIKKHTLLLGEFNAHCPFWNSLCTTQIRAEKLEKVIDQHKLLVNNDMTIPTRLK